MSPKSTFADHFSSSSSEYATFRPRYADALFDWLAGVCRQHCRAWDCGTGNGQAAVHLARHFDAVIATDPSRAQIAQRMPAVGVHYGVMTAEASALSRSSVDLITVAQALHWFDLRAFYHEVRRTLVPGGVLAVWTYGLLTIEPRIDERLAHFYTREVGPYWPPERAMVDRGYADIDFPFDEIAAPQFEMSAEWSLTQFSGYLETWSAVGAYKRALGQSPVPGFIESVRALWGGSDERRRVRWPLKLRCGRLRRSISSQNAKLRAFRE